MCASIKRVMGWSVDSLASWDWLGSTFPAGSHKALGTPAVDQAPSAEVIVIVIVTITRRNHS
jgi:hypothetical protein